MTDAVGLGASYEHCRRVAWTAARNFYYGFALLPAAKRDAMCALYAFMRHADDISDSEAERKAKGQGLEAWRGALDRALAGDYDGNRILPAFHNTVMQFGIPRTYFHDLITGTEMDLTITSYPDFELLRRYCYCVAGTVGLCSVHVFGFRDPIALELAPKLGIAFQLTNILRDVPEDIGMGRVYIPQEDLRRFGCTDQDLAGARATPEFIELMRFEAHRAWQYYEEGTRLLDVISKDSQAALWTLIRIYSGILGKIEAIHYDVLGQRRPGLSRIEKAWIMLRAGTGLWRATPCPRHT